MAPFELRHLRCAVATAATGSFSRAARLLNMQQPALSRRVAELEQRLGVRLFARSTGGARPTAAGQVLIAAARQILAEADALFGSAQSISHGEAGRLALGFNGSLLAGSLKLTLEEYRRQAPGVRLSTLEGTSQVLFLALETHRIDVAVIPDNCHVAGLRRAPVWSEGVVVALAEGHALALAAQLDWNDLSGTTVLLPRGGSGPELRSLLSDCMAHAAAAPQVIVEDINHDNLLALVRLGDAVTLLPEAMLGARWQGVTFRHLDERSGRARLDYGLYWRSDNANPALAGFLALLHQRYPTLGLD